MEAPAYGPPNVFPDIAEVILSVRAHELEALSADMTAAMPELTAFWSSANLSSVVARMVREQIARHAMEAEEDRQIHRDIIQQCATEPNRTLVAMFLVQARRAAHVECQRWTVILRGVVNAGTDSPEEELARIRRSEGAD